MILFERDQQRAAKKRAEENGEFIPAKTSGATTVQIEEPKPKPDYRARGGAFAALFVDESDNESDNESVVTPVALATNKRSYAEAIAPTLGGTGIREANLKKPTWFEMCESDDED